MRERIKNAQHEGDIDEIKARFYSKKTDVLMSQFLASKAIAIMSVERRKREQYAAAIGDGSSSKLSLLAIGKLRSRVEKTKEMRMSMSVTNKSSGAVNTTLLMGLGKFKKKIQLQQALNASKEAESKAAVEVDPGKAVR